MADQISPAQLKAQVMVGADETKRYLDQLTKKVGDFDDQSSASKQGESASKYLEDALLNAHKTIDKLEEAGHQLAGEPSDSSVSDSAVSMVESGLSSSQAALRTIQERAMEYDSKYLGSRGSQAAGMVSDTVHGIVNTGRQSATDAMEMASDLLQRVRQTTQHAVDQTKQSAKVVTGEAAKLAEKGDEMLGASDKASGIVHGVKKLDERIGVTTTATKIDAKVTGGLGKMVVEKGMEMVHESVEYVTETLSQAKIAAGKSKTAQAVEAKAGSMAESAAQTAGRGKEMAQETAQSAKDKTGQAVCVVQDKATEAKDMAMGQAGAAGEMAGQAKQKGGEVVDQAEQTGAHAMGQAQEKGGQAVDMAKDKASQAVETGKETAESAKDTTMQAAEGAKQTGQQAAESAKQTGHDTKKGKEMAQAGVDKGKEMTPGGDSGQGEESVTDKASSKVKAVASRARDAVAPSPSRKDDEVSRGDTKDVEATAHISRAGSA